MKLKNRIQGKKNKKIGIFGEQMAERALWSLGFKCVEPIETGWRVRRVYDPKKKKSVIISATPKEKVSGDFTAIGENGRHVHCEVKTCGDDVLVHSKLEKHQVEKLDAKTKAGALCLLAWVKSPTEIKILRWPVPGFVKGTSIRWEGIR